MSSPTRKELVTQIEPESFQALRTLARSEGRPLQTLVDEALADLIRMRRDPQPRPHIMATYQATIERYGELYKKLAE